MTVVAQQDIQYLIQQSGEGAAGPAGLGMTRVVNSDAVLGADGRATASLELTPQSVATAQEKIRQAVPKSLKRVASPSFSGAARLSVQRTQERTLGRTQFRPSAPRARQVLSAVLTNDQRQAMDTVRKTPSRAFISFDAARLSPQLQRKMLEEAELSGTAPAANLPVPSPAFERPAPTNGRRRRDMSLRAAAPEGPTPRRARPQPDFSPVRAAGNALARVATRRLLALAL